MNESKKKEKRKIVPGIWYSLIDMGPNENDGVGGGNTAVRAIIIESLLAIINGLLMDYMYCVCVCLIYGNLIQFVIIITLNLLYYS